MIAEKRSPATGEGFNDVAAHPGGGAQLGGVGVGPGGDAQGRGSVDDDVGSAPGLDDDAVVAGIALEPGLEVGFRGEQVACLAVALDVSEHQVVGEVAGVA